MRYFRKDYKIFESSFEIAKLEEAELIEGLGTPADLTNAEILLFGRWTIKRPP